MLGSPQPDRHNNPPHQVLPQAHHRLRHLPPGATLLAAMVLAVTCAHIAGVWGLRRYDANLLCGLLSLKVKAGRHTLPVDPRVGAHIAGSRRSRLGQRLTNPEHYSQLLTGVKFETYLT